jgi:hypothetical protein
MIQFLLGSALAYFANNPAATNLAEVNEDSATVDLPA